MPAACGNDQQDGARDEAGDLERSRSQEYLAGREAPVYGYEVIATIDHGRDDFTQGLDFDDGILYEGTGLQGSSRLIKTDPETGAVLDSLALAPEYFGEGVTVLGDEIFQLTYTSNLGFVYDKESLELKRTFVYATEGWGLTHDGESLIMSDGTATLFFLDPASGSEKRRVGVSDNLGPVTCLNELEYVDGEVYANVWKTSLIAVISPLTGKVTAWIDLAGLNPDPANLVSPYVLNGIAYQEETGHLLVTGKCWPYVYEIALISPS
ncbi:MAG: glutaminyl-peptide cyclotransferase [Actinobacteria bacterium]|nr:MAG: glutaminyl-peptide cyclotransferase [Actinomycetota bacterium]